MAQLSSNLQEVNSRTETKVMKECRKHTATKYTDLLGQRGEVFFSRKKRNQGSASSSTQRLKRVENQPAYAQATCIFSVYK